jgi:hypothetical protein
MVRIVSFANTLIVTGALAASSLGFAGVAAAEPACGGSIPNAKSHQPFPSGRGPTGSANCEDALDTSDTSMTDIASLGAYPSGGSYPNGSSAFKDSPQPTT